MPGESVLKIEKHRAGKVSRLEVHTSPVLIGSGAHCDVRLAPDEAAYEQVKLWTENDRLHGRVLAGQGTCLLDGRPFVEGSIPARATLELGPVKMQLSFAPSQVAAPKKKTGDSTTPPWLQAAALLGLAVGFYFVLGKDGSGALRGRAVLEPPALALPAEACPQGEPSAALALADETQLAAEQKRERAPFYARDGLSAVRLFRRAAACYHRASEGLAAGEAERSAAQLHQRLAQELHVRHVRLERLLAQQKYAEAKRESKLITEYVADRSTPYSEWLASVVRESELKAKQGVKR